MLTYPILSHPVTRFSTARDGGGAESKPHEHTGHEEFLLPEGSIIDCDGTEYRVDGYMHLHPGSKHSSYTPNGCLMLVILRGNNRALSEEEIESS